MRTPIFMRRTGLAQAHSEAVQIIETNNSTETMQHIVEFMAPDAAERREAFMDKGMEVLNAQYTTEVVHKQWAKVVEESIKRKLVSDHIWRATLIPIRLPEGNLRELNLDDFQVDRLGHAASIMCWIRDDCEANINFELPSKSKLSFNPKYLVVEYRATTIEAPFSLSSAGTLRISSPSPEHPFDQKINIKLSPPNGNSQFCFPLPDTLPPSLENKFILHKQVSIKVTEIAMMDKNPCMDKNDNF